MIAEMNNLIVKIQLSETQITNESLLEEDEKVLEPIHHDENENDEESDDEVITDFNEKEDFELTQTLKKALQLLTSSSFNVEFIFHIQLSLKSNDQN